MKKILTILTFSLISILSYSNNSNDSLVNSVSESVLKQIPDSFGLTFKQVYTDIKSGLVALGESLKVSSEHVYEILVKQQVVDAFYYLMLGLLSLFLIISFFKKYKSNEQWSTEDEKNPTGVGIIRVLQMVLGCFIFLIFLFSIDTIITGFINPEYGAIKQILEIIK